MILPNFWESQKRTFKKINSSRGHACLSFYKSLWASKHTNKIRHQYSFISSSNSACKIWISTQLTAKTQVKGLIGGLKKQLWTWLATWLMRWVLRETCWAWWSPWWAIIFSLSYQALSPTLEWEHSGFINNSKTLPILIRITSIKPWIRSSSASTIKTCQYVFTQQPQFISFWKIMRSLKASSSPLSRMSSTYTWQWWVKLKVKNLLPL